MLIISVVIHCHSNAVKRFGFLLDNIYEHVCCYTVPVIMLLRDFWPCGIIFMTVFTTLEFFVILD
jgi:hypothetical protein